MLLRIAFFTLAVLEIWAQPGGMGDGIWIRNAAYGELQTFDYCNGHQPGNGQYHHHINPICLRAQLDDNLAAVSTGRLGTKYAEKTAELKHSPILGWAYDGYPVYGPYGYSNPTDASSPIKRMAPSFRLRSITQRRTLPDWILPYLPNASRELTSSQYGPDVSAKFPLGRYVNDYEYVAGMGDLDQYNGRSTVTPEYPAGTYAYFVTVAEDGAPLFPYIINVQLYGTAAGGAAQTVPSDAIEYFNSGTSATARVADAHLTSWYTKGSQQAATAITAFDPSAGPSTTWPANAPTGAMVNGGNRSPVMADVQRVRFNDTQMFMNSNNLPSYTIGPWFEATMAGGVFMNYAASSALQVRVPRNPAPASTKPASGMGPVGVWVNGVAIFNTLDGASYSSTGGDDRGGGGVSPHAMHVATASGERGPIAAGAIVSAYAQFDASFGSSTATATPGATDWPSNLSGVTATLTDSKGAEKPVGLIYVSPAQVNYRMPADAATGFGRVTINAGGRSIRGNVNIVPNYPDLFRQRADSLAAAQILRVRGGQQIYEAVTAAPVSFGTDQLYLVLYGTGIGTAGATATVGGVNATVAYAGPQGVYPGLDQINLLLPASLAGKGRVDVVVTTAGKPSNPVYFNLQ